MAGTPYLAVSSARSSALSATEIQLRMLRQQIVNLVNQERKKRHLPVLAENPLLDRSAQSDAQDMATRPFFDHTNPDGLGPQERIRATGYFTPPCACAVRFSYGENIAKGQTTAAQVMNDWMHSAEHRSNILKPDFQDLGVGYASGLWVQNFGGIRVTRK